VIRRNFSSTPGFSRQPTVVKIAVGVTLYLAFVHFEELIIDRHGLYRFLPYYKFAKFCPWDIAALVAIGWFLGAGALRRLRNDAPAPPVPAAVKLAVGLMYLDAVVLVIGFLARYEVLVAFPPWVLSVLFVAVVSGTGLWLAQRKEALPLSSQPWLVKAAGLLAIANSLLFFAY
jgi:hypothetical protein